MPVAPEGITVSWPDLADTAVIFPGTVACDGSTTETLSPTVVGGRVGFSGTVTVRWLVVTWYGRWPGAAASPAATFMAPARMAVGRKTTCPSEIVPVTVRPRAACQRSTASAVARS